MSNVELKIVKESESHHNDWWNDLTDEQRTGIERGLKKISMKEKPFHTMR